MKYKVNYSGFAYVESDDEEEAQMAYQDGDTIYEEEWIEEIEEVDEFTVVI
jgi:hypothetical protein